MTKTDVWFVYILKCADKTLYTGVTTDLQRRVQEHNNNDRLGAKYTRTRRPVILQYHEACTGRSNACKRESSIKKLTRRAKLQLIAAQTE
ncbi:GIY-YIG nuclease family protein [Aliamphritea ceti]|uniref:GIY-YIG nuclease family protein n=1 Tax=Aliamphritea ceti TaxID=1524258 RepID=UPI0021C34371|nr:GIY-YIG nuclease family protein [Aliamphritea ceti]